MGMCMMVVVVVAMVVVLLLLRVVWATQGNIVEKGLAQSIVERGLETTQHVRGNSNRHHGARRDAHRQGRGGGEACRLARGGGAAGGGRGAVMMEFKVSRQQAGALCC